MPDHPGKVILLVDDQNLVAASVRSLLAGQADWQVHHVAKASEAVAAATRLRPHVILQDMVLPDGSGLELISRYAELHELPGTQVIMLSVDEAPEHKAAAFDAGAFDYIVKMPAQAEFVVRVRHAIRQAEMVEAQVRLLDEAEAANREAAMQLRFREEAERLLEDKSRQLAEANTRLAQANASLAADQRVRTQSRSRVSRDLASFQDLDTVLRRLLTEARGLFGCEAGTIFLKQGEELVFAYAQNDRLAIESRFPDHRKSPVRLRIDRGSIAGAAAVDGCVVVRDAYDLPPDAPFTFNRSFDQSTGFRTRAVMAMALRNSRGRLLAVLQLINPSERGAHHSQEFTEEDREEAAYFAVLAVQIIERSELVEARLSQLLRVCELNDPKETGAHVKRVAEVAAELYSAWAAASGIPQRDQDHQLDLLRPAAKLHDIGKVGVGHIIRKTGKLDESERQEMQRHTVMGCGVLRDQGAITEEDEAVRDVMLFHHARWDGTGYPDHATLQSSLATFGIPADRVPEPRGSGIPLFARLVSIADVFDALLSARYYKEAWTPEQVRQEIERSSGTHFDPDLVRVFVARFDRMLAAHDRFVD